MTGRKAGFAFKLMAALAFALAVGAAPVSAQAGQQTAPPQAKPAELTAAQWREDLRFMVAEMQRRHTNLYHSVDRETFMAAVADLDRRIPALERNDIIVGMMRIAALVGDGHTRVEPRKDEAFQFPSLPVRLYLFEDGLHVRAARPEHASLNGAKVEAIGGVAVEEAIRRASELASAENASGAKLYVPIYLAMPDILEALGLSDSRDGAVLTLSCDGHRWQARVPAGEVAPLWPPDTDISLITPDGWIDARRGPVPLWLQAPLDYHRLTELPEQRALYAQLNMVTNTKDQSLAQFGERILESADSMNPAAVILDLRLNQGGNGDLRNDFVRSLIKAEDEDTRLFVLTARGTFSASQFILDDLDRLTDVIIIGEPASSRPTGYGDAFRSILPNSGIAVRTSIKYWQSGQDMRDWTPVDVAAPLAFADYVAGRDPALEEALNYRPEPGLSERTIAAAKSGGPSAVIAAAEAFVEAPRHRYADRERTLVLASAALFGAGHKAEALELSRWTLRQFPEHIDVVTVMAMIAEAAGEREEAVQAARRALAIDPNNRQAMTVLRNLTE